MTLSLRPYQIAGVEGARAVWERNPTAGALMVFCTGGGKTEAALALVISDFLDQGKRVLWLGHRSELVTQPYDRLLKYAPKHAFRAGIVKANKNACDAPCVFASIDTLAEPERLAQYLRYGYPDLIVYDEAHHAVAPSNLAVLAKLRGPHTRLLGLTATPDRDDGVALDSIFRLASYYGILDGQRDGWLVDAYAVVCRAPRIDELKEGDRLDVLETVDEQALLDHIVKHTVKVITAVSHRASRLPRPAQVEAEGFVQTRVSERTADLSSRGRTGMVFCASARQARTTAAALVAAGLRADWGWFNTPASKRRQLLRDLQAGKLDVLCNAILWGEGVDAPRIDFIVFARACRSRALFTQGVGRGVRLFDPAWDYAAWGLLNAADPHYRGKRECLILDLSGCTEEHSLVTPPALLGVDACDHQWRALPEGKAACDRPGCPAVLPCYASLQAGGTGQHGWPDPKAEAAGKARPVCRYCGRQRCMGLLSPDGRHQWDDRVGELGRKGCRWCPAEWTLPLAGLLKDRRRPPDGVALMLLPGLEPETWAIDLDGHGVLLLIGRRGQRLDASGPCIGGEWRPLLVRDGTSAPEELSSTGPVNEQHGWHLARAVARQARKAKDAVWGEELHGGHETLDMKEEARARATVLAVQVGVARLAGGVA